MTWSNPPAGVEALRTMLLACPSIGLTSGQIHYPSAVVGVDDGGGTADALPLIVLAEIDHQRTPYAEAGVAGLPSGTLTAVYHRDTDPGTFELWVRTIGSELGQVVGLPNVAASVGLCSDPSPAARAVDAEGVVLYAAHRTITQQITYGLR